MGTAGIFVQELWKLITTLLFVFCKYACQLNLDDILVIQIVKIKPVHLELVVMHYIKQGKHTVHFGFL